MNTKVQSQATIATPALVPSSLRSPMPQRAGYCHRNIAGGECADCAPQSPTFIQRKAVSGALAPTLPPIINQVLGSSGQPLDAGTRKFMEASFAHDFSRVRLHTDARAAEAARAVNAFAYTVGRNVVFGTGQYRPETVEGQGLIAHELTHVVQQERAGEIALDRKGIDEAEQTVKEMEARRKQKVAMVERAQWGAAEPKKEKGWDLYPADKPLPYYRIVIHHTADPRNQTVQSLQKKEMDAGYADMPYNFIITEDGTVNEGRQLDVVGAHAGELAGNKDITKDPDYGSIGIALTGDFESRIENFYQPDKPSAGQVASMIRLVAQLVREYNIQPANVLKHSEVIRSGKPKVCPGANLAPYVDALRSKLAPIRAKETDSYRGYFSVLHVLPMSDLLKRLTAFGSASDVEGLLKSYGPYVKDFGLRPQVAMRAVIIHLKGDKATKAERDALLSDSAKEFPGDKQDQHQAILKLITPPANDKKAGVKKASLDLNSTHDPDELEAERVAAQVTGTAESAPQSPPQHNPLKVSAQNSRREADGTGVSTAVQRVIESGGQPLDSSTRLLMESRFDHDFSRVRVHTDPAAAKSARDVRANAYTVGHDIVFDSGRFAPASQEGRRLLAHELTHVAQQRGSAPALLRQPAPSPGQAPTPDPSPGLGPARTQDVEDLIKASDRQGAIDTLVHYKYMDYEIDLNLLANQRMIYDPNLTAVDGSTSMPSWDYLSTPQKAEPAKVRIGPGAFSSISYLYSVIMHEYQHVLWQQTLPRQQESHLLHSQGFTTPDEVEASAWELLHATETGLGRLPVKIANVWENLNDAFWQLDSKAQASERQLVVRAFQKAKDLVKGSQVTLVPFSNPSGGNP